MNERVRRLQPEPAKVVEMDGGLIRAFLDGGRRSVLLWNLFGRVERARELIRTGERVRPGALGGRVG